MSGISTTGFDKKTLGEIIAEQKARILSVISPYANVLPTAVFGQLAEIHSEGLSELWELLEIEFNSKALTGSGTSLDLNVALMGKKRSLASIGYILDYKVGTTTNPVTVPIGFQVTDGTNTFSTTEEWTLTVTGVNYITVYSDIAGELSVNTGAVDEIVGSIPSGVAAVANDSTSTFVNGADDETDEELRARVQSFPFVTRNKTTEGVRNAVIALNTELASLNYQQVLGCYCQSNDTNVIVDGRNPHSIECVVYYPTDTDTNQKVLEAVAWSKGDGIESVSTTTTNFSGTVDIDDKTTRTITVSKADEVDIYIEIDTLPNLTADEKTDLKSWIKSWGDDLNLGNDVIVFGKASLSARLNSFQGADLTDYEIKIGITSSPTLDANVSIDFDEVAIFDVSDITVGDL